MSLLDKLKQNFSEGKVGEDPRPICPLCGDLMNLPIRLFTSQSREQKTLWFQCLCGCIYNPYPIEGNKEYRNELKKLGWKGRDSREYFVHVYFPLIEELTYGRKMLEVGYCMPYILRKARDRGWICTGMDINVARHSERGIEIIEDDFEAHDFKFRRYDLIFMNHFIELAKDFRGVLQKLWDITRPEGVVFVASPDVKLLSRVGLQYWGAWDLRCRLMFSWEAFNKEMERVGFKSVLLRSNEGRRFGYFNDFHGIWQRPYYDEPYIGGYDMGIDFEKVKEHIQKVQKEKENGKDKKP